MIGKLLDEYVKLQEEEMRIYKTHAPVIKKETSSARNNKPDEAAYDNYSGKNKIKR